MLRARLTLVA